MVSLQEGESGTEQAQRRYRSNEIQ